MRFSLCVATKKKSWRFQGDFVSSGLARAESRLRLRLRLRSRSRFRSRSDCGSGNVTRCVKIIDFPWLDCCWLSKFNHNMHHETWRSEDRLLSILGNGHTAKQPNSETGKRANRQHVAKLTTWIFNFASQQRQVICCVDVPGVADEQWPGTRDQATDPRPQTSDGTRTRTRRGRLQPLLVVSINSF